jgi:hypothetical protein
MKETKEDNKVLMPALAWKSATNQDIRKNLAYTNYVRDTRSGLAI